MLLGLAALQEPERIDGQLVVVAARVLRPVAVGADRGDRVLANVPVHFQAVPGGLDVSCQVAIEINQLIEILPNQPVPLLNQYFTLNNLQTELNRNNYDIVHIASHGYFGSSAQDSLILTYDKPLALGKLEALLGGQKHGNAINLLTLSACATAEGNDSAPMGFSGAALKANAQTVLGSLWKVDDAATAELMKIFYQQLINNRYSKARALQEAQKELIQSQEWSNPYYWAPFILVGHWQ